MSELLDPACFLSLTQPERLEQLYLAYGGIGCFMGYDRIEQLRLLAEQIGITDCIDLETDFWRAWLKFLDPDACSEPSLEDLQNAVYALLYAQAGDSSLVSPACFYGLSPDLKEQAIFAASGGEPPVVGQFFVDAEEGDDANEGTTQEAAWKTTAKVVSTSFSGGTTINYRADGQIHYGLLDFTSSGELGNPITFSRYGTGKAVLSGGAPVTDWVLTDAPNNVWTATFAAATGKPRVLWVDGIAVNRVHRTGNMPSGYAITSAGFDTSGSSDPNFLVGATNLTAIEFVFRPAAASWAEPRIPVTAAVNGLVTMEATAWGSFIGWLGTPFIPAPYQIENDIADFAAHTAATFYHNLATDQIQMVPPIGVSDPNSVVVVAGVLETVCRLQNVHDLEFTEGITFSHTTNLQPSGVGAFVEVQANTSSISGGALNPNDAFRKIPAAVHGTNCSRISFDHCVIEHIGGAKWDFDGTSEDIECAGVYAWDASGNGLQIGNPANYTVGTGPSNINIHDCFVFLIGREYRGSVGMISWYVDTVLKKRNEIHTVPYSADSTGWGWGREVPNGNLNGEVEHNLAVACMKVMNDGAGFYLNNQHLGGKIRWNVTFDSGHAGIYADNDSEGLLVDGNVSNGTPYSFKINDTHGNTFQNTTCDVGYTDPGGYFILNTNTNIVQQALNQVGVPAADLAAEALVPGLTAPYKAIRTLWYPFEHSLEDLMAWASARNLSLSNGASIPSVIDKYRQKQYAQATALKQPTYVSGTVSAMRFSGGQVLTSTVCNTGAHVTIWAEFQLDDVTQTGIIFCNGVVGTNGISIFADTDDIKISLGGGTAVSLGPKSLKRESVIARFGDLYLNVWRNQTLVIDQAVNTMSPASGGSAIGATIAEALHFTGLIFGAGVLGCRVPRLVAADFAAEMSTRDGITWQPATQTGLILDLNASGLAAGALSRIPDQSVNVYDAIADSGSTLGTGVTNELNGHSVVQCTASQTKLTTPVIQGSVGTIVMVFGKISSYGVAPGVGGFLPSSKRVGTVYSTIDQMFGGNSAEFFGTAFTIEVNGVATDVIDHTTYNIVILTATSPVAANARFCVGDNLTNGTMTFRLAQLQMYAESLGAPAKAAIVASMQSYWGL